MSNIVLDEQLFAHDILISMATDGTLLWVTEYGKQIYAPYKNSTAQVHYRDVQRIGDSVVLALYEKGEHI